MPDAYPQLAEAEALVLAIKELTSRKTAVMEALAREVRFFKRQAKKDKKKAK